MDEHEYILETEHVSKSFGALEVLKDLAGRGCRQCSPGFCVEKRL